jgi:hypothetical protein
VHRIDSHHHLHAPVRGLELDNGEEFIGRRVGHEVDQRHVREPLQFRQADWYRRKMAALHEDPEQLALFHERDAERKRRERAARRESE